MFTGITLVKFFLPFKHSGESENENNRRGDDRDDYDMGLFDQIDDDLLSEDEGTRKRTINTKKSRPYFPAAMLFFMMYGPYGVGVYNFDLTPAVSMETKAIDNLAKESKQLNTKSMREAKKEENNYLR